MPKKGDRVQFENGLDVLRGVIVGKHVDPNRPDMEETWTVFADTVLVKTPILGPDGEHARGTGEPRSDRHGNPVVDAKGNAKLTAGEPLYSTEWLVLVDDDGVQACDKDGRALHKNFAGDPLQLAKHGVPVPFRVRARRMTVL